MPYRDPQVRRAYQKAWDERRRRARGERVRDDPNGIERTKPWRVLGIGRAWWWRTRRWGAEREKWRHRER